MCVCVAGPLPRFLYPLPPPLPTRSLPPPPPPPPLHSLKKKGAISVNGEVVKAVELSEEEEDLVGSTELLVRMADVGLIFSEDKVKLAREAAEAKSAAAAEAAMAQAAAAMAAAAAKKRADDAAAAAAAAAAASAEAHAAVDESARFDAAPKRSAAEIASIIKRIPPPAFRMCVFPSPFF